MAIHTGNRQDTLTRGGGQLPSRRWRKSQEGSSKPSCQYSFLTQQIEEIPFFEVDKGGDDLFALASENGILQCYLTHNVSVDINANLEYLRETAKKYSEVYGKAFAYAPCGNQLKDIASLTRIMQEVSPEGHLISIDYHPYEKRLVFLEYSTVEYEYYTIFALPVGFIHRLPKELRWTFIEFIAYIVKKEGMTMPDDHFDMSFALGLWDDDISDSEDEDYIQWCNRYLHGYIHELLDAISNIPCQELYDNPSEFAKRYNAMADQESVPLISHMFRLMSEYMTSFSQNSYINFETNHPDYSSLDTLSNYCNESVTFERLGFLVYGCCEDDPVADRAIDIVGCEAGNIGQEDLYQWRILTPDIDTTMAPENYPKRWAKWFERFVKTIIDYEQDYRNTHKSFYPADGCDCLLPKQQSESLPRKAKDN